MTTLGDRTPLQPTTSTIRVRPSSNRAIDPRQRPLGLHFSPSPHSPVPPIQPRFRLLGCVAQAARSLGPVIAAGATKPSNHRRHRACAQALCLPTVTLVLMPSLTASPAPPAPPSLAPFQTRPQSPSSRRPRPSSPCRGASCGCPLLLAHPVHARIPSVPALVAYPSLVSAHSPLPHWTLRPPKWTHLAGNWTHSAEKLTHRANSWTHWPDQVDTSRHPGVFSRDPAPCSIPAQPATSSAHASRAHFPLLSLLYPLPSPLP